MRTDVPFGEGASVCLLSLFCAHAHKCKINEREVAIRSKKKFKVTFCTATVGKPASPGYSFQQITNVTSQKMSFWSTCQVLRKKNKTFFHPALSFPPYPTGEACKELPVCLLVFVTRSESKLPATVEKPNSNFNLNTVQRLVLELCLHPGRRKTP